MTISEEQFSQPKRSLSNDEYNLSEIDKFEINSIEINEAREMTRYNTKNIVNLIFL